MLKCKVTMIKRELFKMTPEEKHQAHKRAYKESEKDIRHYDTATGSTLRPHFFLPSEIPKVTTVVSLVRNQAPKEPSIPRDYAGQNSGLLSLTAS